MKPKPSSSDLLLTYYQLRESGRAELIEIARAWRAYLDACEREMKQKQGKAA